MAYQATKLTDCYTTHATNNEETAHVMTSDPHYPASSPRTSSLTATSAGSCSLGRERRELAFTIAGPWARPAPTVHRTAGGVLDVAAITRSWLGWHRLACGGADMPAHDMSQARGVRWTPAPARRPVELEDKVGRHVPPWERAEHTLRHVVKAFERMGVLG